jgi:N utilization substance protein B
MNKTLKFNAAARHKARRFALQALYQWQIAQHSIKEIAVQFAEERLMPKADQAYFQELITQVPAKQPELDAHFQTFLDRNLNELDPIELAILRMAAYEMAQRLEIPYRVVIDEAVELAKEFGAEESYKYINGVVDQMAKTLRKIEINS